MDQHLKTTTGYEWVVEQIEISGDDRDVVECSYWPEGERARAEALAESLRASGAVVDFGLCRRRGNDHDGDVERGYIYQSDDGSWPDEFDDGAAIPKRFGLSA